MVGLVESSSGVKSWGGVDVGVITDGRDMDGLPTLTIAGSSKLLFMTLETDCAFGCASA